ncbi:serine/threonine-protein kinase [Nocardia sp. NPDC003482]
MKPLGPHDPRSAGRHRLIAVIGQGAMGRVLLGSAPDGRPVAVKMIHRHLARRPEFRARFRMEVLASQRVTGVHTAAVVDADPDAPEPWLAAHYVAGPSLRAAVDRFGPLSLGGLRLLTAGLAGALLEIHRARVIHRDLKPGNVLLAADGPRVIDFGIARALTLDARLTGTGALVGSPAFMSPEQAEGRELTPASDVFAVGALLVLAATGRSPFLGASTTQTLYNVVHARPDISGVPESAREIVEACLAKTPADRPTPGQLLDAADRIAARPAWPPAVRQRIAQAQREAEHRRAEPGPLESARAPRRSGRRVLLAAATATTLAAVLTAGTLLLDHDPATPAPTRLDLPPDRLRLVDACALLTPDVLPHPTTPEPRDTTTCAAHTDRADLTLRVGAPIDFPAARPTPGTAGGLAVLDTTASATTCGRAIVTPAEPQSAVEVTVSGESDCGLADSALRAIVDRLSTNPPLLNPARDSVLRLDPCATVGPAIIEAVVTAPATPRGVHQCRWSGADYELTLDLQEAKRVDAADDPLDQIDGGALGPLPVSVHTDPDGTVRTYHLVRATTADRGELITLSARPHIATPTEDVFQRLAPVLVAVVDRQRKQ